MLFALCQYGTDYVWKWAPSVGATMYRTTIDIANNWNSMINVGFAQAGLAKYAGHGHYLDPDSLEIGNGVLKPDEERLQMSLWSIIAAPLILGNDVSHMDTETLDILSNKEVIAIDQDSLVQPGDRVWAEGMEEVWTRPLVGGKMAVALFNRGHLPIEMPLNLKQVGWNGGSATARDVWAHQNVSVKNSKTFLVPKHGVALFVLSH
jgi:alpha-galactosidase